MGASVCVSFLDPLEPWFLKADRFSSCSLNYKLTLIINLHSQSVTYTKWFLLACCSSLASLTPWAAAQTNTLPPGTELYPGLEKVNPQAVPDISEVRLERTRCLASCPAYTVTLRTDGSFSYTGTYNVPHMGQHTGKVDAGQLRQLLRYIDEIGFSHLKKNYLSPFLDNATAITSVVHNGKQKTVTHYANSGPATLWALETLIDTLLQTATWDLKDERK